MDLQVNWKLVHSDFEKSLYASIQSVFGDVEFKGCLFHYIKAIWKKCRGEGLYKKPHKKITFTFISVLKEFPFLDEFQRKQLFRKLKINFLKCLTNNETPTETQRKYVKFINYFERTWISYENTWNFGENFIFEPHLTNNVCEHFHKKLNDQVGIKKPKISYLALILKRITSNEFDAYCTRITSPRKKKNTECNYIEREVKANKLYNYFMDSNDFGDLSDIDWFKHGRIIEFADYFEDSETE
eukprot:GAHX01000544.1.p2 GENE.GAHX01000544.1~~GAHX01000544.1.p2  ORF type:complete len:242 (+),score=37.88 GAHX01000544.1:817-1542(+)